MPANVTPRKLNRSPRRIAWSRFKRNRLAVIGLGVLGLIILVAIFGPFIVPYSPTQVDLAAFRQAPSAQHWLGTDSNGRDVLSRLVSGSRVSLTVGLVASLIAIAFGALAGAAAGLRGGMVDTVVMRAADIILSFPSLVVIVVLVGILGPSLTVLIAAIAFFEWPTAARLVRGVTLSVRERSYVEAARSAGASSWWLIRTHLLPASVSVIAVVGTVTIAQAILLEAALSFLGLGVQPPQPSWGNMLNDAQSLTLLSTMPWLWIPPGLAVAVTVLAVNFVGDGLRDASDPQHTQGGTR